MVNASKHPNINLFTYSDVVEFSGIPGDYKVKIRKNARYVDEKKNEMNLYYAQKNYI